MDFRGRFLHALNYCMLLPGPEAQQLATYIGWLMHRTAGGIMAGGLFVLPGIIAIMALSYLYAAYGDVPLVTALFFGLKAAVLAIVIEAVVRIGKRALNNDVLRALAAVAFVGIYFFNVPFPLIMLAAGLVGFSVRGRAGPAFKAAVAHGGGEAAGGQTTACSATTVPAMCGRTRAGRLRSPRIWLALWLGAGRRRSSRCSGPPMSSARSRCSSARWRWSPSAAPMRCWPMSPSRRSRPYGWLTAGEMLDGLGMAETTPGPLIMVLQFVGFMAAFRDPARCRRCSPPRSAACSRPGSPSRRASCGFSSARPTSSRCAATARLPARCRRSPRRSSASSSISRSGLRCTRIFREVTKVARFGLSFDSPVLGSVDPWALALSIVAVAAMFRFKIGMPATLALCAALGIALHLAGLKP